MEDEEKKIETYEQLIDKHYQEMFDFMCAHFNEGFSELKIEIQESVSGKTIIRSWKDRDRMLKEEQ